MTDSFIFRFDTCRCFYHSSSVIISVTAATRDNSNLQSETEGAVLIITPLFSTPLSLYLSPLPIPYVPTPSLDEIARASPGPSPTG